MFFDPAEWKRLEKNFITWAETQPDLRAAIAVGSKERVDPPPDEWSDLDWMIFLNNREEFVRRTDWLQTMGEIWSVVPNRVPTGDPEWLVTYAGGYNVDFVLLEPGALAWLAQANPLPEPFVRGYRVMFDKDGLAARIPPAPGKPPAIPLPSLEEYNGVVSAFWYTAFYVAKQLCREELFLVKVREGNLKECLMNMLAWHARATRGPDVDIWHMGRFMERWADSQTLAELPATFAHYDAADSWRALLASVILFRRLANETALLLGYTYPLLLDQRMSSLIEALSGQKIP